MRFSFVTASHYNSETPSWWRCITRSKLLRWSEDLRSFQCMPREYFLFCLFQVSSFCWLKIQKQSPLKRFVRLDLDSTLYVTELCVQFSMQWFRILALERILDPSYQDECLFMVRRCIKMQFLQRVSVSLLVKFLKYVVYSGIKRMLIVSINYAIFLSSWHRSSMVHTNSSFREQQTHSINKSFKLIDKDGSYASKENTIRVSLFICDLHILQPWSSCRCCQASTW